MRLRALFLLTAAAASSALAPAPASAETVAAWSSGLEGKGAKVSDAELGEMRGKFISPDKISYFGVQMQTSWQGPDGVTTEATLLFSVDFLNGAGNPEGATPVLMVSWSRDGEGDPSLDLSSFGPAAADGYVALPIGGLGSTQGAVQSQQIAGSDNQVRNDMRIAIIPAALVQMPSGAGLTPVTSGGTQQFGDGDTLQFMIANNQLGLALTGGGTADQVQQRFDGMSGQAAQHVVLSTSGNAIHNNMGIVVGHDQLGQAGQVSLQNALSALRGVGF